jgi:hypothetical protein
MGYTITIGNAVPRVPTNLDEDIEPDWTVEGATHPEAPSFPGDGMTGKGSDRSPSYGGWAEFLDAAGLRDLFFGARGDGGNWTRDVSLMRKHPGVALLRPSDLLEIRHARIQWEAKPWPAEERIAGWDPDLKWSDTREPDPKYDGVLARLIWLEWWVEWALANCKLPAVGNT